MTTQDNSMNTEVVVTEDTSEAAPTYEQQVNTAVAGMKKDSKTGKYVLPDGLSDGVKYSANAERRRRDTESALGKTRLQLQAEKSVNEKLTKRITETTRPVISAEMQTELDDLMYENPNEWRRRVNELENSASATTQEELTEMSSQASQQAEIDARENLLAQFNLEHPEAPITDDAVKNDIPPRITNLLARGEISFTEYLSKAHDYLMKPKVVGGISASDTPNLGKAGGGASPSQDAFNKDTTESYATTVL